ncbi:MAG TPA: GNAT family N-acetyltransferase [Candidatus Aquilonibacter sp.]
MQPRFDDIAIEKFTPSRLSDVATFAKKWSSDDVYDRFGSFGSAGPSWLLSSLEYGRAALLARNLGAVVALLDFEEQEDVINFGIIVLAALRRKGIGSSLLATVLAHVNAKVTAETSCANRAANALLRRHGFTPTWLCAGEMGWEWPPAGIKR